MLKRTIGTFIMPSGNQRPFAVQEMPGVPTGMPAPAHVILSYGAQRKVYGRERLMNLNYDEVVQLFDHDFNVPKRKSAKDALSVTFYRPRGMSGGYDTTLMSIDHHSWAELLLNVIRIDIAKPEPAVWPLYLGYALGALGLFMFVWWFIVACILPPLPSHVHDAYRF